MFHVTINGISLEVSENLTVLQAAEQAGITIPTLCYHKDLTPYGGCRLCVVEIQGARLPATSCTMPVSRGMVILTETPKLIRYRRFILELLLSKYYDAGYTRSDGKTGLAEDTQFAYWANFYGINIETAMARKPSVQVDSDPNPYIWVDMNKCIQCTRCIRACAEVQGRFVWGLAYRGYTSRIVAGSDTTMLQARCESCGACAAYCPTGALNNKMSVSLGHPDRLVTTTCSYCSVGCQFDLNVKDEEPGGRVFRVTSNSKAPINGMHLCVKGRYGYEFIHSPKRLTSPRVRKYLTDGTPRSAGRGPWVEVDWDTALDLTARQLLDIRDRLGSRNIGLLSSGIYLNEENYLMGKLARQVLNTNNIDLCAHLYHPSTTTGLDDALGLHAQTNSLDDAAIFARSMLVIGSNTTEEQPVFGAKIRQAVLRRGCKLVVAHPDFINMSEYAALRLTHKQGSAGILINGLINIILNNGWEDRNFIEKHTKGFGAFQESIRRHTAEFTAEMTGVEIETLTRAAKILHENKPAAVIWGVDLVKSAEGGSLPISLVNLQMVLGNLGVSGGGLIPLRTQNNSQGACDMGAIPRSYAGYQSVGDPNFRQRMEAVWGTDLPERPGMNAAEMISAAGMGELKALYILGEDLAGIAPDSLQVRRCLEGLEFVVLQTMFEHGTSAYCDVLLPGTSFTEKTGTFTNTERRVQMVRQAIDPIGDSRPDWQIIRDLAMQIQQKAPLKNAIYSGWDYQNTSEVMDEISSLAPIYSGISHARLEQAGSLQWPVESMDHPGTANLLTGAFEPGVFR